MIRTDRKDHEATTTVADSGYKVVIKKTGYSSDAIETHYASTVDDIAEILGNYFTSEPTEEP